MNVVFMGTPEFAVPTLEALVKEHNVTAVVTQPDKPKGRGKKMMFSAVKEKALEYGLTVYQPEKVKDSDFVQVLKELAPDIMVVVAFGQILSEEILNIPKYGCINVHGSLLPKYRGAAPIQWAIINGEKETGITTMYMDVGMDTGDMILKEKVEIEENETTGMLWERLATIGANLLVKTVKNIENGIIKREKQDDEKATYAPMLSKEIANIDWENKTAIEIKNLVRGLNPIIGAYTFWNGKKYKLWKVQVIENEEFRKIISTISMEKTIENIKVGEIIYSDAKKGLYVKAKDAVISVEEIQAENAKRMKIDEFLRGYKL